MFLVQAQHKMGGGGEDAFDGGQFFGHERRNFLQAGAVDDEHEIVAAGHEVGGFDFFEAGEALGEAIETAAAFGCEADFDDGADDAGILLGQVEHGANAEQDAFLFQGIELTIDIGYGQLEHLRHLRGVQAAAFEQQFQHRIHAVGSLAGNGMKSILKSVSSAFLGLRWPLAVIKEYSDECPETCKKHPKTRDRFVVIYKIDAASDSSHAHGKGEQLANKS